MPEIVPVQRLREYFAYHPDDGLIVWKRGHGRTFANAAGTPAFSTVNSDGYLNGKFDGVILKAHRVAWALHTGAWPDGSIDHINGNRIDNRFANLRVVDHVTNGHNRRLSANNTTGFNGVVFRPKYGNYAASIRHLGKRRHLGTFSFAEDAAAAVKEAAVLFGFHSNHGSSAALNGDKP